MSETSQYSHDPWWIQAWNDREVHLLTYEIIDIYGKQMNWHNDWSLKSLDLGFTNLSK